MTPPTSAPPSARKRLLGNPWTARTFAVAAVAGLVLSLAFVSFSGSLSSPEAAHTSTVADPAKSESTLRSSALSRLDGLTTLADPQEALRQATAASMDALGKASRPLSAAKGAAAILPVGALPELPDDYLPGMDVASLVPTPRVPPFPLPAFSGGLDVDGLKEAALQVTASPVAARGGLHAPTTGVPQADAVLGQLAGAFATVQGALATLNSTLGGLSLPSNPAPDLTPPGVTWPSGGLPGFGSSSQAQDANDAADPDEKGAQAAHAHATALLGSAEGAYALTQPSLASLLKAYKGLAGQVEALVDAAHATATKAEGDVEDQLQDRLDAVQAEAARAQKEAAHLAAAYRHTVEAAAAKAQATLRDALDAHTGAVQAAVAADLQRLQALAAQVKGLAEARKAEVAAVVESTLADLARLQAETGLDTTASAQSVRDAGTAALQKVQQDALAQARDLAAAGQDLETRAKATLRSLGQSALTALASLNGTVEKALQQADLTKAYLVELARAQAAAATAAEQKAADTALAQLASLEREHVAKLLRQGLDLASSAEEIPGVVEDLAGLVDQGSGQVQSDVRYIAKVSEDYGQVPVGERMERAGFWSGVAGASSGRLDRIATATQDVLDLADQVRDAAAKAHGQIEALA